MWSRDEMDDSARVPEHVTLEDGRVQTMPELATDIGRAFRVGGEVTLDSARTIADYMSTPNAWTETWQRGVFARLAGGEASRRLEVLQAIKARRAEDGVTQVDDLLLECLSDFLLTH